MLSKTGIACLLGSLAAALGLPAAAGAVTFNPHADYPSGGTYPQTIAVGDFNGDGRPDLAIANKGGGGTITVLLNKGNGTFGAPATYTVGGVPTGIAVGDFYGNGRLDLAIAKNTNEIVILVNTGNGTFGASSTVEVPYATRLTKIVAGNFNGHEDLAATDESEERIYLALNDGKGDFTASTHLTTSGAPMGLAVGDLNDDGHEDIVAANAYMNTVGVFTGNGNGTFSAEHSYPTGEDPTSVAVANLKDGAHTYPDVVTTDSESGKVSVLLNKGNGELEEQHEYEAGADAYGLAVGAFDGDSHVDLAVANFSGEAVSVLPGKGDGTFGAPVRFKTAPGPAGVVAADFDGVAGTDLAVASEVSAGEEDAASVLLSPFEQLTPSSDNYISLGSAWVGETGAPGGVTFTNTGNTVVTIDTAYVNGEMMIEALDTCLGATLAPGASCVVEAALRPTAAAEHLSGEIVVQWGGELADWLLIRLTGDATLGPGHSKVSASNTPERCPLDYSDCEVILDFAKSGYLSEQALIDDGITIIYGCVATRCETTILLYGSTNLFELLSNAHGAGAAFAGRAKKRARRVLLGEERVTLVKGERRRVRVRLSATGRRLIRKLRSNATLELVQETRVKGKLVSEMKKIKLAHAIRPAKRKA